MNVSLDSWIEQNPISDAMYYAGAAREQCARWRRLAAWFGVVAQVVSTHRSKSCVLPVVRYELGGSWLMVRDNFYNMMASVQCPRHVRWLPRSLATSEDVHGVYCEGFARDLVFPCWDTSPDRFTVEILTTGELLDVMASALDAGRPAVSP